jgi:hypothetical protein
MQGKGKLMKTSFLIMISDEEDGATALSLTTFCIMGLFATLIINDTEHKDTQ